MSNVVILCLNPSASSAAVPPLMIHTDLSQQPIPTPGAAGPSLKFHTDAVVALTGALFQADLDGTPVAPWKSLRVKQGSTLSIKAVRHSLTAICIPSGHCGCTPPAVGAALRLHPNHSRSLSIDAHSLSVDLAQLAHHCAVSPLLKQHNAARLVLEPPRLCRPTMTS